MKPSTPLFALAVAAAALYASSANATLITIAPSAAFSFQDEGTLQADDTGLLDTLDGIFGPSTGGTVINEYYATGSDVRWFDAISASFDLAAAGVDFNDVVGGTLRFFARNATERFSGPDTGAWPGNSYKILPGAFNDTDQDADPPGDRTTFDSEAGEWFSHSIAASAFTGPNFDITLRFWDAEVDAIELVADVPAPASLALLGLGLVGLGFSRRNRA